MLQGTGSRSSRRQLVTHITRSDSTPLWFALAQSTGDSIKRVLQAGGSHPDVEVEFDWKESIGHPDNR